MTQRLHSIDHLRVYAALTVLFGHTVHVLKESATFAHEQAGFCRRGIGAVLCCALVSRIACYTERERYGRTGAGRSYVQKRLRRIVPSQGCFTLLFAC